MANLKIICTFLKISVLQNIDLCHVLYHAYLIFVPAYLFLMLCSTQIFILHIL